MIAEEQPRLITDREDILRELVASKDHGTIVGIWATALGLGFFMCAVENIHEDHETKDMVVILKEKDLNGVKLEAHVLYLNEIQRVHPFQKPFEEL